eukprot:3077382-Pleurochrysis_carterae.AAC.1
MQHVAARIKKVALAIKKRVDTKIIAHIKVPRCLDASGPMRAPGPTCELVVEKYTSRQKGSHLTLERGSASGGRAMLQRKARLLLASS